MSKDGKTDEAEVDRTDLAEDRTRMANERTFAGWLRTSMALVALAMGLRALMRSFEPDWIPKSAATALIAAGIVVAVAGWRRAVAALDELESHVSESTPTTRLGMVVAVVVAAYVVVAVLLWLTF